MTILDVEVGAANIHMAKNSSPLPMILKNTECPQKKFLIKLITGSRFPTFASLNTCRFTEGGKHVDLFSDCAIQVHFTVTSVRNFFGTHCRYLDINIIFLLFDKDISSKETARLL